MNPNCDCWQCKAFHGLGRLKEDHGNDFMAWSKSIREARSGLLRGRGADTGAQGPSSQDKAPTVNTQYGDGARSEQAQCGAASTAAAAGAEDSLSAAVAGQAEAMKDRYPSLGSTGVGRSSAESTSMAASGSGGSGYTGSGNTGVGSDSSGSAGFGSAGSGSASSGSAGSGSAGSGSAGFGSDSSGNFGSGNDGFGIGGFGSPGSRSDEWGSFASDSFYWNYEGKPVEYVWQW